MTAAEQQLRREMMEQRRLYLAGRQDPMLPVSPAIMESLRRERAALDRLTAQIGHARAAAIWADSTATAYADL